MNVAQVAWLAYWSITAVIGLVVVLKSMRRRAADGTLREVAAEDWTGGDMTPETQAVLSLAILPLVACIWLPIVVAIKGVPRLGARVLDHFDPPEET